MYTEAKKIINQIRSYLSSNSASKNLQQSSNTNHSLTEPGRGNGHPLHSRSTKTHRAFDAINMSSTTTRTKSKSIFILSNSNSTEDSFVSDPEK